MMLTTTQVLLLELPLIVACARDARREPVPAPSGQRTQQTAHAPKRAMHGHGNVHARGGIPDLPRGIMFVDPGAAAAKPAHEAVAVLQPTMGNGVTGTVRFVDRGGQALELIASIDGLPQGAHAFHVHMYGDCSSADGKSAGPHFHFVGSSLDKTVKIITGNLGELVPDARGHADQRSVVAGAKLHGPFTVIGRSVVVHAKANDPTVTPDGGAGDRIACGVIGVASPMSTEAAPPVTSQR